MPALSFGVRLPVAGTFARPEAIVRVATAAEELGFEAAWVHDYIVWTRELDRTHISCGSAEAIGEDQLPLFFESLTTLAYVAAKTSAIRLGVAVLVLPYRNPIVTAKQIATLDVLANGRLILGVGVGARRSTRNHDFEVLGVPRADKYERTREYLEVMRTVWMDERPAYAGRFVNFAATEIYPKPAQKPHPPLWVGGSSSRAVEWVAEFGTGWLPAWLTPEDYRQRAPALLEAVRAHGRDPDSITIATEIVTCVAERGEDARRRSDRTIDTLTAGFTVRTRADAEAASLIGSVDEVSERIAAYAAAGVRHFELKFVYGSLDQLLEQMGLFASRIAPAFAGTG